MTANQAQMAHFAGLLSQTTAGNTQSMKAAEEQLRTAEQQPSFGLILLELLRDSGVNAGVRQAGAIYFKNYIKRQWCIDTGHGGISQNDRLAIKQHLFSLMLQAPKQVQVMLGAGLEEISLADYPADWQGLLPEIVQHLKSSQDMAVLKGTMETAHRVFMKFRNQSRSEDLLREIKYTVEGFQETHLMVYKAACAKILTGSLPADQLTVHFEFMLATIGAFFSLNVVDLPEFFEDHREEYFNGFLNLLSFHNEAVAGKVDQPGLLEQVKGTICECFKLYADKYQTEFSPYLLSCVKSVWELLVGVSQEEKHDQLVAKGIAFLSAAAATNWQNSPFEDPSVLSGICEKVVFPNILLRDSDVELFEDNPLEYVRRDTESADQETRRRSAMDLVKAMGRVSEVKVTDILVGYVKALMGEVARVAPDRAERFKDACIYLCIAMAVRGQTQKDGVTIVNQNVNIGDFFTSLVVPELSSASPVTNRSVLRASCLKFIAVFRNQLTKEQVCTVLPNVCKLISAECSVVHTYAAICLEKLITVRDRAQTTQPNGGVQMSFRYDPAEMRPSLLQVVNPMLQTIASQNNGIPMNEYLMRCVARIFAFLKQHGAESGLATLGPLAKILMAMSANPANPVFNHNLFEAIASICKVCVPIQPDAVEGALLPTLGHILTNNVVDFLPYTFQLLGLLLDASPSIKPMYRELFTQLLTVDFWRPLANVPGLVRLFKAYFTKHTHFGDLLRAHMETILQRFQMILHNRKTENSALDLLNAVYTHLPFEFFQSHFKPLVTLLFHRLSQSKSSQFKRAFVVSCSLFIHKNSGQAFAQTVNEIQPGLVANLMANVWVVVLKMTLRLDERKICTMGLIKLMVLDDVKQNAQLFHACGVSLVHLLGFSPTEGRSFSPEGSDDEAPANNGAGMEYEASFNKLRNTDLPGAQNGLAADVPDLHTAAKVLLRPHAAAVQQVAQANPELGLLVNFLQ